MIFVFFKNFDVGEGSTNNGIIFRAFSNFGLAYVVAVF